ncbi:bifunctional ADP-dependent NAD(P)H-hydrate dehydratase/NAD(P)H-hydrate epimerase [Limnohabitans sp. JirII-29]|uniref:NAD(P)H-hydrate dehydratase n=1 Tax=Limnohabitans sp. JirII-29 TaxID=1835756 RepID=UPI000D3BEBF5|nr:NAD(P)H-hydrate dehydratase [Limnohabitans sp. JirII-29]PUE28470.1 bifunctional ADP-dependent NAD(P)H-hydrate dehydratase/NAD(P)H-hydrate epimerase [Limnohabitans sp. JirII-29]
MTRPTVTVCPLTAYQAWPLYDTLSTQHIEAELKTALPEHTLMERAGLATAQLALAIAPHAQRIWIACGPGNNGGDGLEAAIRLQHWGKQVVVTWLGNKQNTPSDAQRAGQRAIKAGITFAEDPPETFDLAIDALLGLGVNRAPDGTIANWLHTMQTSNVPVLCIDLPTGLCADTGEWLRSDNTHQSTSPRHTLSLLTLKPGLFTADGRDAAGQVWFDDLVSTPTDKTVHSTPPVAYLQVSVHPSTQRPHNSHKGSFGELIVMGGASGMTGAAVLAGVAALHGGAGRVYLGLLDAASRSSVTAQHPALMVRAVDTLEPKTACVVCGCGAGDDVRAILPKVLSTAAQLVLDADALNAIASDASLLQLVRNRTQNRRPTVLTPHPLEAARLLKCSTRDIQNNRLHSAQQLAELTGAVVVLKGSGTVIACSGMTPVINHTGSALLATAGTGDVLAGFIGAKMAQGQSAFEAACHGAHAHGLIADTWPTTGPALDAALLAASIR